MILLQKIKQRSCTRTLPGFWQLADVRHYASFGARQVVLGIVNLIYISLHITLYHKQWLSQQSSAKYAWSGEDKHSLASTSELSRNVWKRNICGTPILSFSNTVFHASGFAPSPLPPPPPHHNCQVKSYTRGWWQMHIQYASGCMSVWFCRWRGVLWQYFTDICKHVRVSSE